MEQGKRALRPVSGRFKRRPRRELERAEQEIRDIRYALDQSSIVAITDAKGVITFANDKFCEISKYSRDELLGQTHRIINSGVHPREFFIDLWKTISCGKVWRGEICNRAKDGSLYWVATVIVPFLTPEGRPRQYVAIRTDITERKRAEERARKAIEVREEFLAIVSHDLKNPLSSIAMNAEFIQRLAGQGNRISDRALTIHRSAGRMHRMISDLLDISRIESRGLDLKWENVSLSELIEEAWEMVAGQAQSRAVRIEQKVPKGDLKIPCDKERILQVFSNLLGNAIKFSPEKGEIRLEVFRTDARLEIHVLDSGPGIPSDQLPNVFKRFWRSATSAGGGTGLGLYISKWIVDAHGGAISAGNRPEGGARFSFWLPVSRPPSKFQPR